MKEATSKTGQQQQKRRVRGADTTWRKGVWVGRSEATNEHILLTDVGLRLTNTVRRMPLDSRFAADVLKKARGVPWDPMSGVQRGRPKKKDATAIGLPSAPAAVEDKKPEDQNEKPEDQNKKPEDKNKKPEDKNKKPEDKNVNIVIPEKSEDKRRERERERVRP